jgi:hypothetical protein
MLCSQHIKRSYITKPVIFGNYAANANSHHSIPEIVCGQAFVIPGIHPPVKEYTGSGHFIRAFRPVYNKI